MKEPNWGNQRFGDESERVAGVRIERRGQGRLGKINLSPFPYAALEQLATSPEFRQQFGDNYLKGLEERAVFLTQAYEDAGWQGSVTAGVEGGRFAAELVGVLTAVKGGAQITAKLPTAAKNLRIKGTDLFSLP